MATNDYEFTTLWKVRAPIDRVFDTLKEGDRYAAWWKPAYLSTVRRSETSVECTVRARLPYILKFTIELIREIPRREILLKSVGELSGTGRWALEPAGEWTHIRFEWRVRAEKFWMRCFSFLLRPLFLWNHDWVMHQGEACLQAELDRRA